LLDTELTRIHDIRVRRAGDGWAPTMTVTSIATAVSLNAANLHALPGSVSVPTYERSRLGSGIVHIGVGGFHRAHQAVYLDDLARRGLADGWGITGVGLRSPRMSRVLDEQDCLYTVVVGGGRDASVRVVGSMTRYLYGVRQRDEVLDVLAAPATRLVTLTITGNGYNLSPDGDFRADDPAVLADLRQPHRPSTVFGYLVEALDRRRRAGEAPFTVLSCDNVPRNGHATRTMVVAFAKLRNPALARWIDANVAFPSSVVDRITPKTTPDLGDDVLRTFGVADRWPVRTEPFSQWVIEDRFCNGRPPLEQVGVRFVGDVTPYELTKKRLLNGSHSALGYLGHLLGHRTTADVMADPTMAAFVGAFIDEVIPMLPRTPGIDLPRYRATLLQRLADRQIADQVSRLCERGSTKMPAYLLPSLRQALAENRPHGMLTLAVAGWLRYPVAAGAADPQPARQLREWFRARPDWLRQVHDVAHALEADPRRTIRAWLPRR
jgi:fructuronate reductase/mannitol 2-dehydrogenase